MSNILKSGTIPADGFIVVDISTNNFPCSAWIDSVAGGRKIEVSQSGAVNAWKTPAAYDIDTTAEIGYAMLAPIRKVKFTGTPGDVWGVL